jgi:hypothetical protein
MGSAIGVLRYVFLALATAGILGMFAIRAFRKRALSEIEVKRWQHTRPALLGAEELTVLQRWQTKMRLAALAILFYVGVMVGLTSSIPDEARIVRWIAFLILPAIVIAGVVLQFSVRCPRCSMLLGLQTSLGIPDVCERCGVSLRAKS